MLDASAYPDQDLRPHICIIGSEKDGEQVLEVDFLTSSLNATLMRTDAWVHVPQMEQNKSDSLASSKAVDCCKPPHTLQNYCLVMDYSTHGNGSC